MSNPFRDYEVGILNKLLSNYYSPTELRDILEHSTSQKFEYTGYGFFITLRNPAIGTERRVCDQPLILAEADGYIASFVAFLEDDELILEIFPPDAKNLPEDFRYRQLSIHYDS